MFIELMPLLGERTVMLTVARIDQNRIHVNVRPLRKRRSGISSRSWPRAPVWRSWRLMSVGPALGFAMLREASWSRSNSFWGTSRFKRPNDTLAASSGFDQPSMIALALSRILELGARLWKGCRQTVRKKRMRYGASVWIARYDLAVYEGFDFHYVKP
jgi:hypothetical protein